MTNTFTQANITEYLSFNNLDLAMSAEILERKKRAVKQPVTYPNSFLSYLRKNFRIKQAPYTIYFIIYTYLSDMCILLFADTDAFLSSQRLSPENYLPSQLAINQYSV